VSTVSTLNVSGLGFVHEAVVYAGEQDFLASSVPFVTGALSSGAPILVAVNAEKIVALRHELGADERRVEFVLMSDARRNPGRIISMWRDFVGRGGGRACFGIGEPVWSGRGRAELVEGQRHEHLLNRAFAGTAGFRLRCPYDATSLDAGVLEEALRSHPRVVGSPSNPDYVRVEGSDLLGGPVDPAPARALRVVVGGRSLRELRRAVSGRATEAGVAAARRDDVVLVANELAANALRHGAGTCTLAAWSNGAEFAVEVHDEGRLDDPLVGRRRPDPAAPGGRGLWLVHELADLVQVRSTDHGTTVRATFRLDR
jgi:anti-sigma regulatory factor (Ser/Thr protein kinase)